MPIYKYRTLDDHSVTWELEQLITDKPFRTAYYELGKLCFSSDVIDIWKKEFIIESELIEVERVIQPPTFHLKGAGFHKNDYPSDK